MNMTIIDKSDNLIHSLRQRELGRGALFTKITTETYCKHNGGIQGNNNIPSITADLRVAINAILAQESRVKDISPVEDALTRLVNKLLNSGMTMA